MSNWLKSKCNTLENIEAEYMTDAFARMGLYADFSTHEVDRAYENGTKPCQALLRRISDNSSARIGLNFEVNTTDDGKQLVKMTTEADWWGIKYTAKSFMDKFTIEYIAVKAISTCREQGFEVREETDLKDGRRRLVLARAA